jgi:hypothetical protein
MLAATTPAGRAPGVVLAVALGYLALAVAWGAVTLRQRPVADPH